jgi:hypothetical protein
VQAVNRVFPNGDDATWPLCQRYLSHADACAELIDQWEIRSAEAGRLMLMAGTYMWVRTQYAQAERLLCKARAIRMQVFGPEHPDTIATREHYVDLLTDNSVCYPALERRPEAVVRDVGTT